jgi:hypothetical protein
MKNSYSRLSILALMLTSFQLFAAPIYLNIDNISVEVGGGTTATSSNNTFSGGATIDKVIDAPSADAEEFHNQSTHIWFTGGTLELLFDFRQQYDLSTLHFWNYTGEGFDVDNISFTFFDDANINVGALFIMPDLGSSPGIRAQDILLSAPLNVRYVTAVLSGTNDQIDFQNIGFTASLSTDRCITNPNDPICNPVTSVSTPPGMIFMFMGLIAFFIPKRRSKQLA